MSKTPEQHKRPRRTPLTREEVQAVIAFKRRKELQQIQTLKKSLSYKIRNVFLVLCFFIFCEVLFCFFGPCKHQTHYTQRVSATYAPVYQKGKGQLMSQLDVICVNGTMFSLMVDDFIKSPPKYTQLDVGSDFIMNCELKAKTSDSENYYRLFRASPVLLLCAFCSFILLMGMYHNLNLSDYTLWGLTVLSAMTLLYLICV